jgi:hypothetical protein
MNRREISFLVLRFGAGIAATVFAQEAPKPGGSR